MNEKDLIFENFSDLDVKKVTKLWKAPLVRDCRNKRIRATSCYLFKSLYLIFYSTFSLSTWLHCILCSRAINKKIQKTWAWLVIQGVSQKRQPLNHVFLLNSLPLWKEYIIKFLSGYLSLTHPAFIFELMVTEDPLVS